MNEPGLVARGLRHRWRTNLAVAAGVALATAVLVGSLGAGDTLRESLRRHALARLGRTVYAVSGGERFYRSALSVDLASALGGDAVSLIVARGSASVDGGAVRASPVQVLGVDPGFWSLAPRPMTAPGPDEMLLNPRLAELLGVGPGDEVVVRVSVAPALPLDAPLSARSTGTVALRLTVRGVAPREALGDFGLSANQAVPLNAFVHRETLAAALSRPQLSNTVLLSPPEGTTRDEVERALDAHLGLRDAGLSLRRVGDEWELASDSVLLPRPVEAAALEAGGRGVLTWFVDTVRSGDREIAYAFVSTGSGDRGVDDGGILLNQWAARELGASVGDTVLLVYMPPDADPGGPEGSRTERLVVRGVVPIEPLDRELVPAFPGFAGVTRCTDWDPGVPLDLTRLGRRDQDYWEAYGGSPKAFVSPATARRLWANRFGRLTAVRFDADAMDTDDLARRILASLDPRDLGLEVASVLEQGLTAAKGGVDFGGLFLGLSVFLIGAALLLTTLLFRLGVEQRAPEIDTLGALGYARPPILRLLLAEGAIVALAGGVLGIPLGLVFHRAALAGLQTSWREAVRTTTLVPYVSVRAYLVGFAAAFAVSLGAIVITAARSPGLRPSRSRSGGSPGAARPALQGACALASALGAAVALAILPAPARYLATGGLVLATLLLLGSLAITLAGRPGPGSLPSIVGLGIAQAARRPTRSLAVASTLACGVFIVASVGAGHLGDAERRGSGTGGYGLLAETVAPLPAAVERRLLAGLPQGTEVAGLRVLDGDDASCLNLNRVTRPRLLGVDPRRLGGRFTFARVAGAGTPGDPWSLLEQDLGDAIPGVVDQSVMTWGLGLALGDEIVWLDESGLTLRVRLVACLQSSVLQGSVVVSESALARHFPSTGGHRILLIDTPRPGTAEVGSFVDRLLGPQGVELTRTAERLEMYASVEATYRKVFALLGWLGILVGTLGLAVVVARNTAESAAELALLRAVGLRRAAVLRFLIGTHAAPIALGLVAGAASGAVAALGAAETGGAARLLAATAGIGVFAATCVVLTAASTLSRDPLEALRND